MRYLFLLSLLFLVACNKNEFSLDFDLSQEITENYNVIYYATDKKGGLTIQAVASVRDGKCELKGITRLPTLAYVTLRNSKFPLVIYAQRGNKIKISGDNSDPLNWNVSGNEINDQISVWRNQNISTFEKNIPDSVNQAVKNFVENNPDNPVSTILMLCYYNREVNERGYADLMSSLKGSAKDAEWLKITGRADQLYHYYSYPARLESLVMRSDKEGADTLQIDEKNPLLIMFWQTGYRERKDLIDSLKILEKEFPDTSRLIADICVDVDSVGWKNSMKKDSLTTVRRFWAPAGLADETVMKFKVKTLPYFIVFDKEGSQYYRGDDLSEAIKDYRMLMKGKDD